MFDVIRRLLGIGRRGVAEQLSAGRPLERIIQDACDRNRSTKRRIEARQAEMDAAAHEVNRLVIDCARISGSGRGAGQG